MVAPTNRLMLTLSGTIQTLDVAGRHLEMDVYGIPKQVDVPSECRISGRVGVAGLNDLRAGAQIRVECMRDHGRLQARSLEILFRPR